MIKHYTINKTSVSGAQDYGFEISGPVGYCVDIGSTCLCLAQDEDGVWCIWTGLDEQGVTMSRRLEGFTEAGAVWLLTLTMDAIKAIEKLCPNDTVWQTLAKCKFEVV